MNLPALKIITEKSFPGFPGDVAHVHIPPENPEPITVSYYGRIDAVFVRRVWAAMNERDRKAKRKSD